MTGPIRTLEDTIAWFYARLGISRHDDRCDWSGGYNVDDCALCVSMGVFGSRVAWNVDVLIGQPGTTWHAGKSGLSRGDIVIYDWDGNGVGDHTEVALGSPNSSGYFQTIGANGSDTIAVAVRTRNGNVKGYVRPQYKGAPATPSTPKGTRVVNKYHYEDRAAKTLKPGAITWLKGGGQDRNVVGAVGPTYLITPHVYADGLDEGDSLQVTLVWENTKNKPPSSKPSAHYTETVRANRDGVINATVSFTRGVVPGDMVFVRVSAPKSNKKDAHVTLIDCDAVSFA